MTDIVSKERRSWIMAQIHGQDTTPEIRVRKLLHRNGYRFRLHREDLPGKPDIVLPKYGAAVFVHGCFWHGHRCQRGRIPRSNSSYWRSKIDRNVRRDARVGRAMTRIGWHRVVVWACELKNEARLERRLAKHLKPRA